jgi:Arc/MetJ-type ribon-helix-helix transcriptional regulator
MALVHIGVKVEPSIKEEISSLVDSGKYRDITEFMHAAIKERLERDKIDKDEIFRQSLIHLLRTDPEIIGILEEISKQKAIESALIFGK